MRHALAILTKNICSDILLSSQQLCGSAHGSAARRNPKRLSSKTRSMRDTEPTLKWLFAGDRVCLRRHTVYLFWYDDNTKKATTLKIEEAIAAYTDRFKTRP